MNNWLIILLPALPSVIVGVYAVVITTLYAHEKRKLDSERGQHKSLRQQFGEADDAHVQTMKEVHHADTEIERLIDTLSARDDKITQLKAQVEVLVKEHSARDHEITILRERSTEIAAENAKLHFQNNALMTELEAQLNWKEKRNVDEDTVAPSVTQASAEAQVIRNPRQRKGAAREKP